MTGKIAVIGANAYLAEGLADVLENVSLFSRPGDWVDYADLGGFDWIINFSIQPDFRRRILSANELIDANIANAIKDMKTKFVMISSRKVYGTHENLRSFYETDKCYPLDFYAKNKVAAENGVLNLLPNRSLVLRVANIIDFPSLRPDQRVFMGWIRDSMRDNGELNVTENPDVRKDFITRDYFHHALRDLMNQNQSGVFNVGAGFAVSMRELLPRIVGRGNCVFSGTDKKPDDQFVLSVDKLHQFTDPFSVRELYAKCDKVRNMMFENIKVHVHGKN